MSIIAKYIGMSFKKNFTYRLNWIMVVLDTLFSCFSIWLFWRSLMELDIHIPGWNADSIQMFIGFSLISKAVANLTVGDYDIQRHITEGTLDNILVKPVNSVLLILLDRPDFLQFFVMFAAGLGCVFFHCPAERMGYGVVAVIISVVATLTVYLVDVMIFIGAFWLKRTDSMADIYLTIVSIREYPLVFLDKKLLTVFTYVIPLVYVGTIPIEVVTGGVRIQELATVFGLFFLTLFLVNGLWKLGRRRYESTN